MKSRYMQRLDGELDMANTMTSHLVRETPSQTCKAHGRRVSAGKEHKMIRPVIKDRKADS